MEKEEIARNEQFLLFPQCYLLNQKIVNIFDIISLFVAELEEPKIGMWRNGLKVFQETAGTYVMGRKTARFHCAISIVDKVLFYIYYCQRIFYFWFACTANDFRNARHARM